MTNHIEELMKAAGVVPVHLTDCSFINIRKGYDVGTDCCPGVEDERLKCEDCEHSKETQLIYPAFTPAKQLELIKLIGQQSGFQIHQNEGMDWLLSDSIYADLSFKTQGYSYSSFENALCKLTINLLKKKALDKSAVKEILKDD